MKKSLALLPSFRASVGAENRLIQTRARGSSRVDPYRGCFQAQLAVLASRARFKSLKCGRRAGKTTLAIDDLIYGLENDPDGSESIYGALTIGSAKRIMWEPTKQEIKAHGISWYKLNHNDHTITNRRNDNILRVYGSETVRELEKPRGGGKNLKRIRWDECGAQRPTYLKYLFQDVLQPMMMDNPECDAWMMGSPGPAPAGFWYDITDGDAPGWERFAWTARDNPHVSYDDFVSLLFATNGWNEMTPTYRREYLGLWEADPSRIVFRYDPARNWLPELPPLAPGDRWVYCLACDFGVMDATSTVALCWPERFGRGVYAISSWQQSMLTTGEAAVRIHGDWTRYQPRYLVGDVGGIGKAFQLEWNRRYPGVPMLAANKQDKRAGLEFTSDAFHVANARRPDGSLLPTHEHRGLYIVGEQPELQKQVATLQWDEDREDIQEGQDDNSAVPLMYGYKQSPAFLGANELPPPPEPVAGTTWQYMPPKQHTAADDWRGPVRRRQIR